MSDFIRARTPEQKAQRLGQIKAATAALFAELPYHEVTLTTIAEALGWSRGNLYKYVTTKEEIFLHLYKDAFGELVSDLTASIARTYPASLAQAAHAIAAVSLNHKTFFSYQNLLPQVIETNVPFESLVAFKRAMGEPLAGLNEVFARCVPNASPASIFSLTHAYRYHASGLFNTFDCAQATKEAMRAAGMEQPAIDLKESLADFLTRLMGTYAPT